MKQEIRIGAGTYQLLCLICVAGAILLFGIVAGFVFDSIIAGIGVGFGTMFALTSVLAYINDRAEDLAERIEAARLDIIQKVDRIKEVQLR